MDQDQFNEIISTQNFDGVPSSDLNQLIQDFPYFSTAHILLAKNYAQSGHAGFEKQLAKAALYSTDRAQLYDTITSVEAKKETVVRNLQEHKEEPEKELIEEVKPSPETIEDNLSGPAETTIESGLRKIPPSEVKEQKDASIEKVKDDHAPAHKENNPEETETPVKANEEKKEALPANTPEAIPAKTSAADELMAVLRQKYGEDLKKPEKETTPDREAAAEIDEKPKISVSSSEEKVDPETSTEHSDEMESENTQENVNIAADENQPTADDVIDQDWEALQKDIADDLKSKADVNVSGTEGSEAEISVSTPEENSPAATQHADKVGEKHTFTEWLQVINKKFSNAPTENDPDETLLETKEESPRTSQEEEPKVAQPDFIDPVAQNESQYQLEAAKEEDQLRSITRDRLESADTSSEDDVKQMAQRSVERDWDTISETLAEILTNQGKTDRAIEIYRKLSLKYPEKSSYFASRIDKLTK